MIALTEQAAYGLGLSVAAVAAESMARGIEMSASDQAPNAMDALNALAGILRKMEKTTRERDA